MLHRRRRNQNRGVKCFLRHHYFLALEMLLECCQHLRGQSLREFLFFHLRPQIRQHLPALMDYQKFQIHTHRHLM